MPALHAPRHDKPRGVLTRLIPCDLGPGWLRPDARDPRTSARHPARTNITNLMNVTGGVSNRRPALHLLKTVSRKERNGITEPLRFPSTTHCRQPSLRQFQLNRTKHILGLSTSRSLSIAAIDLLGDAATAKPASITEADSLLQR